MTPGPVSVQPGVGAARRSHRARAVSRAWSPASRASPPRHPRCPLVVEQAPPCGPAHKPHTEAQAAVHVRCPPVLQAASRASPGQAAGRLGETAQRGPNTPGTKTGRGTFLEVPVCGSLRAARRRTPAGASQHHKSILSCPRSRCRRPSPPGSFEGQPVPGPSLAPAAGNPRWSPAWRHIPPSSASVSTSFPVRLQISHSKKDTVMLH